MHKLPGRPRRPRKTEASGRRSANGACLVLAAICLTLSSAGAPAASIGESLTDALHELQRTGIRVIFSSQTVTPDLRVLRAPEGATAEEQLRSLLGPHGLGLQPLPGGGWVVVIERPARPATLTIAVTAEPDGAPVRGAVVSIPELKRTARTDRRGRAEITDLGRASYTVVVRAEGFATAVIHREAQSAPSVEPLVVRLALEAGQLAEVVVQTSRYGADGPGFGARTNRSRAELEASPGIDEDLARALQQLPGAASGDFSARTHVRGGRDNETLFRFDDVTLVDPYHLKDFQGLFSAIDPANSEATAFWTGAFPIEYGQRTGAIVDIEPREITKRTAELGLSVLNSSFLFGTPFAQDRGTVFVSGRVSNLARISQWLDRDIGEPEFRDLTLRATWRPGERTQLAAGLLAIEDSIDVFSTSRSQQARADYDDSYSWLRLTHEFRPGFSSSTLLSRASLSDVRSGQLDRTGISSGSLGEELHSYFNTLRQQFDWSPLPTWYFTAGVEWIDSAADYDFTSDATYLAPFFPGLVATPTVTRNTDTSADDSTTAAYASARWQIRPGSTAEIGLRHDRQSIQGGAADGQWSLRANFRQRLSPATTVRVSWGQFSQAPWVSEALVADGLTSLPATARVTESNLSIEHAFDRGWLVRAEAYDKRESEPLTYFGNELSALVLLPEIEVDRARVDATSGHMRGVELTVETDRARELSGWLSYTWARAEDRVAGRDVPRAWDQRQTVQAGLAWTHTRWQVTGVLNWHSGWPFTPLEASTLTWTDPQTVTLAYGPRNSARYSQFMSLDLRASYEWPFARGTLQASVEVRNAFNRGNPCCRTLTVETEPDGTNLLEIETGNGLGMTPIIGVRWRY